MPGRSQRHLREIQGRDSNDQVPVEFQPGTTTTGGISIKADPPAGWREPATMTVTVATTVGANRTVGISVNGATPVNVALLSADTQAGAVTKLAAATIPGYTLSEATNVVSITPGSGSHITSLAVTIT